MKNLVHLSISSDHSTRPMQKSKLVIVVFFMPNDAKLCYN